MLLAMGYSALASLFKHYDSLVADWLDECDFLEQPYLPEPWWGWAPGNGHPLHAVVINLNPGKGGMLQRRKCIRCACGERMGYREAMADGTLFSHLRESTAWHKCKREKPLFAALGFKEDSETFPVNTLCIEAYPHHSDTFDEKIAQEYLGKDGGANFWRMMQFAAEASALSFLKNVVIIRICFERWLRITKSFNNCFETSSACTVAPDNKKISGRATVFRLKPEFITPDCTSLENTEFVCVSGTRNNFPASLGELLSQIPSVNKIMGYNNQSINHKNQQHD